MASWNRRQAKRKKEKIRIGKRYYNPRDLSEKGRQQEERVENILQQMWQKREISSFQRYTPNGEEDRQGKDFSVTKERKTIDFGITISERSAHRATEKHPDIPQIHLPLWMKDEDIRLAILNLFIPLSFSAFQ